MRISSHQTLCHKHPQLSVFKWQRSKPCANTQCSFAGEASWAEGYRQAACLSLLAKSNAEKWIPLLISVVLTVAAHEPEVRDMTPNYGHCRLIILMEKMKEGVMGGFGWGGWGVKRILKIRKGIAAVHWLLLWAQCPRGKYLLGQEQSSTKH